MAFLQRITIALTIVVGSLLLFIPHTIYSHTEENNKVVIHIDEKKFEPQIVTIPHGTQVIFENVGKADHWPAADSHPSHKQYDGTSLEEHCAAATHSSFDACGPLAPGKTWSFTFTKEGTFAFHDHLWPHLTGEIIVTKSKKPPPLLNSFLSLILQPITNITNSVRAFFYPDQDSTANLVHSQAKLQDRTVKKYEQLVTDKDPRIAILTLQADAAGDEQVSAMCHDILHLVGRTAYKKYGGLESAVSYQSDYCNSGYIHGLFESYFTSVENPLEGIAQECKKYASGKRAFDLWQCHHGVGHGFMYLTGGNLDESLILCQKGLGNQGAASCQNGVYMEVFNAEILAKEKHYVDPTNPFNTCKTRSIAKDECYLYVPTYLSQTKGMDYAAVFTECKKAESQYEALCISGIGAEAVKRNMNNVSDAFSLCKLAGSVKKSQICISGIVSMYMNQTGSYESGNSLCSNAPQDVRSFCRNLVKDKQSFFN